MTKLEEIRGRFNKDSYTDDEDGLRHWEVTNFDECYLRTLTAVDVEGLFLVIDDLAAGLREIQKVTHLGCSALDGCEDPGCVLSGKILTKHGLLKEGE